MGRYRRESLHWWHNFNGFLVVSLSCVILWAYWMACLVDIDPRHRPLVSSILFNSVQISKVATHVIKVCSWRDFEVASIPANPPCCKSMPTPICYGWRRRPSPKVNRQLSTWTILACVQLSSIFILSIFAAKPKKASFIVHYQTEQFPSKCIIISKLSPFIY